MTYRRAFSISLAILGSVLIVPLAHGQGRGMRASSGGFRSGSSFRANRGGEFSHRGRGDFENGYGLPFLPFYSPDYYDSGSDLDYAASAPEAPAYQSRGPQTHQPPAPPPAPGNTLILENHDGQWVRVPTGSEIGSAAKSVKTDTVSSTNSTVTSVERAEAAQPRSPLPPAVLVFRDGHSEEVQKYVIHGADLYASAVYSTTGSWTKTIPLAELDIPASLKANQARGAKFNLPSGPNEVVVRF